VFIGTELCVTLGHSCCSPSSKTSEFYFGATVAQPVVNKRVSQHVRMEIKTRLSSATFRNFANPLGSAI
jgi:hypothetical protein